MGTNFEFTEEEKQQFRENPEEYLRYRKTVETSYVVSFTPSPYGESSLLNLGSWVQYQQRLPDDAFWI